MKLIHGMWLGVVAALGVGVSAFGASPSLVRVNPPGGQRGTEVEVTLVGQRLVDPAEVLFYSPDVVCTKVEAGKDKDKEVKATFRIAGDARLGEHQLRLRTRSGVSDLRTFYVGAYPVVQEEDLRTRTNRAEPNDDFNTPQAVPLNCTVQGCIHSEDVDHYAVEAKKGQRITAEIEGMRLGLFLFDPYLAIFDEKHNQLAACDDTALALQDPVVSVVAPADGKYVIQVRESSYGGNSNCLYRLHVGDFPRPTAVYPPGGRPGEELSVRFIGDARGEFTQKVKLPAGVVDKFAVFAEQEGKFAPSPNYLRVSPAMNVMEVEPNDDVKTATAAASAELPVAFNGIISKPGDVDFFKFGAKKGQALEIRVYARHLRSPLDSVLVVYNEKGNALASNDDSGGPDSYLRFNVAADGEYLLSVRDNLGRGGADYVYRVEVTPPAPSLVISMPTTNLQGVNQDRQAMAVPRGNRFATVLRATRTDASGDVSLRIPKLPDGVKISSEEATGGADLISVVFEAAADAPLGATLSEIVGTVGGKETSAEVRGGYQHVLDLVEGNNNTPMYQTVEDRLAVAVTEELPFKLTLVQPKVPIVQAGQMNLKVIAERKKGFDGAIQIRLLNNPPGISGGTGVQIPAGKNEGIIPISANGNAQVRKWKIAVIGSADVSGPAWCSSELVDLEVAPPMVAMKLKMTSVEQGKSAKIECDVEQKTKFEGKAKVQLMNLPANVTSPEAEITSADAKVELTVQTTDKTPVAQAKGLFCQVTVTKDGEPIVHRVGFGGVLRVDPPSSGKKAAPGKPARVAQAQQAPKNGATK